MKTTEKIFNAATSETTVIERDMSADEIAAYEKAQAEAAEIAAKAAEAETAKAAAQAKLAALGLTTDDLKALGLGNN